MQIHDVMQGSPEWLALRAQYFTASEAPAMMGVSPNQTRTELLRQKHTGLTKDFSSYVQERILDRGHAHEAAYRPIAERYIGDDLYPVTGSEVVEGLNLLASFDGLTMDYNIGFEHKDYNQATVEYMAVHNEPPEHHVWQLEHQLLVSGAKRILFVTSDGTDKLSETCWYTSNPERRAALIAGWKQFAADLANYVPTEAPAEKPTGKAPETLPALRIEVTGSVTASNLEAFKTTALTAIRGVNRTLTTDQDFADAEQSVKWCEEVETRLEAAKQHALSQTASIDALFKAIDDISAEARCVRLELGKLVQKRKDEIRANIISTAQRAASDHIQGLNTRLGAQLMPAIAANFAGVIKGKRSLANIQDAVDTELARVKIEANAVADRIQANVVALKAGDDDWAFLFPDLVHVAGKSAEDFGNLLSARVAKYKLEQEAKRVAALVSAPVQRIDQAVVHQPVVTTAVVDQKPSDVIDNGSRIKLGDINARLSPVAVTAAGLSELGFESAGRDKSAVLYRESDFQAICHAIARHVMVAAQPMAA